MGNTLITFVDKYYDYGGDIEGEKRGLTIGGYEAAWLADLVAAFILEKQIIYSKICSITEYIVMMESSYSKVVKQREISING